MNLDLNRLTLSIDRNGVWRHEGIEITHERTWKLFSKNIHKDEDGHYFVKISFETAYVDVEDAPLIIEALRVTDEGIRLRLTDDTYALLDPESLWFSDQNIPYCKVRDENIDAKFNRTAYYELAELIRENGKGFELVINGETFQIKVGK